jgi:DNA recombination-dependent growth factor C
MSKFKNPFKAAIPFRLNTAQRITEKLLDSVDELSVTQLEQILRDHACPEPMPSQWRTIGLTAVSEGMFAITLGDSVTLAVEIAERVLPSKVRDQELNTRIEKFVQLEGRKPGKKEFAELREDVEHTLLPRAFVKRSAVLATFTKDTVFLWTSSHKKADDAVAMLCRVLSDAQGVTLGIAKVTMRGSMRATLTAIAKGGEELQPGRAAVLQGTGEEKRTIRVKDRDIQSSEIQALLDQGYEVTALAVHCEADEFDFDINEHLTFSKLTTDFSSLMEKGDEGDSFRSVGWLMIRMVQHQLDALLALVGEMEIKWGGEDDDPDAL